LTYSVRTDQEKANNLYFQEILAKSLSILSKS